MGKIEAFINSEMRKFVVSQKKKLGYPDDTNFYGYTFKDLEKNGSRIGCSTLYAIFEENFDHNDTSRFWFDLQIGVYDLKRRGDFARPQRPPAPKLSLLKSEEPQ